MHFVVPHWVNVHDFLLVLPREGRKEGRKTREINSDIKFDSILFIKNYN